MKLKKDHKISEPKDSELLDTFWNKISRVKIEIAKFKAKKEEELRKQKIKDEERNKRLAELEREKEEYEARIAELEAKRRLEIQERRKMATKKKQKNKRAPKKSKKSVTSVPSYIPVDDSSSKLYDDVIEKAKFDGDHSKI